MDLSRTNKCSFLAWQDKSIVEHCEGGKSLQYLSSVELYNTMT